MRDSALDAVSSRGCSYCRCAVRVCSGEIGHRYSLVRQNGRVRGDMADATTLDGRGLVTRARGLLSMELAFMLGTQAICMRDGRGAAARERQRPRCGFGRVHRPITPNTLVLEIVSYVVRAPTEHVGGDSAAQKESTPAALLSVADGSEGARSEGFGGAQLPSVRRAGPENKSSARKDS